MSSSASRRIFRVETPGDEVFVVGGPLREAVPAEGPLTTVSDMLEGAKRRAETTVAKAAQEAADIIAVARAEAAAIRDAARQEGLADGRSNSEGESASLLEIIRQAAADGLAIRDAMIADATPAMANAITMAARRVVGAAYQADPSLTADACADAVRAAAGQHILSIRVNPEAIETVRAALVDVATYIRPDEAVEIGGCVVDLRNGTIDATLDARLDLMGLALRAAGGAE